jgi:hypothetical protein
MFPLWFTNHGGETSVKLCPIPDILIAFTTYIVTIIYTCVGLIRSSKIFYATLIVKTDNGTISAESANKYSCKYIVLPETPGTAKITVYKKYHGKLKKVGEMFFRVKQLPPPEPMVGNIDKDTINKKMLIAMGGVRALQVNSSICADFEVLSYKVTLTRNDTTFAVINNTGARYNPALLEHFNKVKNNDQVIFSDITVRYFDNKPFGLKILSYKVTE